MATRKKRCGFFSNLQNPATACKRLASRLQIALTAHLVHTPRKPQSPRAVSRVPESHTGCLCLAASCRHRQAPSSRDVLLALHHVSQRVHCPCSLPPSNKDVPCLFSSPCTLRLLWSCHDGNTISSTMTFGDRQARATRIRNSRDPNAPRARVRDFNEILAGRCDSRVAMLKSKVPRLRRGPQLFSKAISAVRACCSDPMLPKLAIRCRICMAVAYAPPATKSPVADAIRNTQSRLDGPNRGAAKGAEGTRDGVQTQGD